MWRVLQNPAFICIIIAGCLGAFVETGMVPFVPKYIETAFRMSTSSSNYALGKILFMLSFSDLVNHILPIFEIT